MRVFLLWIEAVLTFALLLGTLVFIGIGAGKFFVIAWGIVCGTIGN